MSRVAPEVVTPDRLPPRLLVLTDIGGDPDDQQSMVRLLSHSNEFEIAGLIATSRMGHGQDVRPDLIEEVVRAYDEVWANLSRHAAGYRPASELLSLITAGTPVFDEDDISNVIGDGRHTAGSAHVIAVVDAATDGRPVNICVWGGAADLAQALNDVRRSRPPRRVAEFVSRIRVHAIGDQDGAGAWIKHQFPDLWYIDDADLTGIRLSGPCRGMYQNDARMEADPQQGNRVAPAHYNDAMKDEWDRLVQPSWVEENIRGHGPLGEVYPIKVWQGPTGDAWPRNGRSGVKEGDTPSWFSFFPNGLNVPHEPSFGGWGGRFIRAQPGRSLFTPAADVHATCPDDEVLGRVWSVARWREAYQREFAARLDWATARVRDEANHPPCSPLPGPYSYLRVHAVGGGELTISGTGWTDPDGDLLSYHWWFYADASTPGVVPALGDASARDLALRLPTVRRPAELQLILEVTDQPTDARVPMTRYQRVLIALAP